MGAGTEAFRKKITQLILFDIQALLREAQNVSLSKMIYRKTSKTRVYRIKAYE